MTGYEPCTSSDVYNQSLPVAIPISSKSDVMQMSLISILEMMNGIGNKQNIPWFDCASQCLSDPSANCHQIASHLEEGYGLQFEDNDDIIGMDLSNLGLTGFLDFFWSPPTLKSLDLSSNDLEIVHLDGLRDKSLERLNVENNRRCHIKTDVFASDLPLKSLYLSSNQIFPWIDDLGSKRLFVSKWMDQQNVPLSVIIMDGITYWKSMPFYREMLHLVEGVTNKEVIPWYELFRQCDEAGYPIRRMCIWHNIRQKFRGYFWCRFSSRKAERFVNLSGLGLEGHVDLGHLPRSITKLDLSANDLSDISFGRKGRSALKSLSIQNNEKLKVNLSRIHWMTSCFPSYHLAISSNQIKDALSDLIEWLIKSTLSRIEIDGVLYEKRSLTQQVSSHYLCS